MEAIIASLEKRLFLMPKGLHTLLLTKDLLLAFGRNLEGQLGIGHCVSPAEPVQVPWEGPPPVQADWGFHHSLVLDEEGSVWESGRCRSVDSPFLTFKRVPELPRIVLVVAGYQHSAALDENGVLWAWTAQTRLSWASDIPCRVQGFPKLRKVACGRDFLVGEADNGLWVFGDNAQGQLGVGHKRPVKEPINIRPKGLLWPLRSLSALYQASALIDSRGRIWSAGANSFGQLGRPGDGTVFERITDTSSSVSMPPLRTAMCGEEHTLALDEEGNVWCWGRGAYGQLGTGNTSVMSQPGLLESLVDTRTFLVGGHHTLVFKSDGKVIAFGLNQFGQLGLGHKGSQMAPASCPLQPNLSLYPPVGEAPRSCSPVLAHRMREVLSLSPNRSSDEDEFSSSAFSNEMDQSPDLSPRCVDLHPPREDIDIWQTIQTICDGEQRENPIEEWTEEDLLQLCDDFRSNLARGNTPTADWNSLLLKESLYKEELEQQVDREYIALEQEEASVAQMMEIVRETKVLLAKQEDALEAAERSLYKSKQTHERTKQQLKVTASIEPFLKKAVEVEAIVHEEMKQKLGSSQPDDLTCDDLGFVLNLFGVSNIPKIAEALEEEVTLAFLPHLKEDLLMELGVVDVIQQQRILLGIHHLTNGLILNRDHQKACQLCQSKTPESSVEFLEEAGIALPAERVLELKAIPGHLMLMSPATIAKNFKLKISDAIRIHLQLEKVKEAHLAIQVDAPEESLEELNLPEEN